MKILKTISIALLMLGSTSVLLGMSGFPKPNEKVCNINQTCSITLYAPSDAVNNLRGIAGLLKNDYALNLDILANGKNILGPSDPLDPNDPFNICQDSDCSIVIQINDMLTKKGVYFLKSVLISHHFDDRFKNIEIQIAN